MAVKESKKQGRAVEILDEARLEMEKAIEEDEPGGQGIRFVIMIGKSSSLQDEAVLTWKTAYTEHYANVPWPLPSYCL